MQVSKYHPCVFFDFSKKISEKQIAMQFIWRVRHPAVSMPLDNLRKTGNVKSPAAFFLCGPCGAEHQNFIRMGIRNMNEKLVIVESPKKARTISKMLGDEFTIKASMGHVRDLPERSFGVDIENNFTPQYEESKERGKHMNDLKNAAKGVGEIYLASDPDREGEAIAWHLREVLGKVNKKAQFHRVTFHEITKSAISKAFVTPGDINMDLVDSQQARRILDRIVGYTISPLLWSRIEKGLSAGRVQSVALRLVCEREREITSFIPKEYWNFSAKFSSAAIKPSAFTAKLFKINGDKFEISSKNEADNILEAIKKASVWNVGGIESKPVRRFASPPFITSTLQQAASSALGFSPKFTMNIAQQLYEGVELGGGEQLGLITYMRTDSVAVASEAQAMCRAFISTNYGQDYVPEKPNFYKTKSSAQAAHEAIRPTDVTLTPEKLKGNLDASQLKLYTLIWRRFVASQMAPAEQMRTSLDVETSASDSRRYTFRATATDTTFQGFLRAYNIVEEGSGDNQDEDDAKDSDVLKKLKKGDACSLADTLAEQKFTEPPPRYSDATLVKELELNGVGRPSTYATIVDTIRERNYVTREKGKLSPTELGFKINDYLVATLSDLFQVGFTAEMENKLDEIEAGKVRWTAMMKEFYDKFSTWMSDAKQVGAPDAEKADSLIKLLSTLQKWNEPEKSGKRTYDDKKFFTSVTAKYDKGSKITQRQWEALLALAIKYKDQLPGLNETAEKFGFSEDIENAEKKHHENIALREEYKLKREQAAAAAPPQENIASVFKAMDSVNWEAPAKSGRRFFDDKKFYTSLKKQSESGKVLSEKQIAALGKMARKYSAQLPTINEIAGILGIDLSAPAKSAAKPAGDSADENTASPTETPAAAGADQGEINEMIEALSKVTTWTEPSKAGRRFFDDKKFYESLAGQHASGRTLSPKQVAALKKLAAKYQG